MVMMMVVMVMMMVVMVIMMVVIVMMMVVMVMMIVVMAMMIFWDDLRYFPAIDKRFADDGAVEFLFTSLANVQPGW
jgi:hypothetical protein